MNSSRRPAHVNARRPDSLPLVPIHKERHMPGKRPNEPIAPTNIPGRALDPKIPPDQIADSDADLDERTESDEEQQARESEKAFDQAITRLPPG